MQLAFTVNDFQSTSAVSSCSSPVTTRVFAPPHLVSWTNTTTHLAAAIIAHYCNYFSMDYPLPKEDHFVVPQFFYSAMENWGLIAYRFDALLLQPDAYTVGQLQRVAQVVAHELAHQWFGNLVTAAWWSESQSQQTTHSLTPPYTGSVNHTTQLRHCVGVIGSLRCDVMCAVCGGRLLSAGSMVE